MGVLDFLDDELAALERAHRRRVPRVLGGAQGARIVLDGREVVSFSSNDYLGLAAHPAVAEAARAALDRFGFGAGASRLIVGNAGPHEELERAAAALVAQPAARLFNSGFAANTGLVPVLAGAGDQIFSDELNHASLIDGCRLSRAGVRVYPHGKIDVLDDMVAASAARRKLIVTESVFSMDGDVADLAALRAVADRHGAILVVDEAHGTGVMGEGGVGALAAAGVRADAVVATLGKALGAYGAFVAGPRSLAELLWNRSRPLVFTTGLPPMVAAAALAAIEIARGPEGEGRRRALRERIEQLAAGLGSIGVAVRSASPIIPLVVGDDRLVMAWTARLLEAGLFVQGVRPPTVPEGTARLRVALSASHTPDDVDRLCVAIRACLAAGLPIVPRET